MANSKSSFGNAIENVVDESEPQQPIANTSTVSGLTSLSIDSASPSTANITGLLVSAFNLSSSDTQAYDLITDVLNSMANDS